MDHQPDRGPGRYDHRRHCPQGRSRPRRLALRKMLSVFFASWPIHGRGDKGKAMDPAAEVRFTRMYNDHYDSVLAYAGRRVGRTEAEDIANDVFVVLWRRIFSKN